MMITRVGLGLARPITRQALRANRLPSAVLARYVSTVKASHDQGQEVLVAQRRNRPVSPDLTIYKPQLTWILSSFHRITGIVLALPFYGLTCGYAAAALIGSTFDAGVLVSAFAGLPFAVKLIAKAAMAFPFTYHCFNGIRHMVWDFGKELTLKGVYRTGYIMLGVSAITGTYLTFFL